MHPNGTSKSNRFHKKAFGLFKTHTRNNSKNLKKWNEIRASWLANVTQKSCMKAARVYVVPSKILFNVTEAASLQKKL